MTGCYTIVGICRVINSFLTNFLRNKDYFIYTMKIKSNEIYQKFGSFTKLVNHKDELPSHFTVWTMLHYNRTST